MTLVFGILRSNPMQFLFGCKNMELKEKTALEWKRGHCTARGGRGAGT
jgi:hypothetical protein